jgi:thiamine pyrophosphokinase
VDSVLIVADGVWEDDALARQLASEAEFVIAADGGFAKALRASVHVDLVVGDFDSLDDAERSEVERMHIETRRFPAAKDASDLELALGEALAQGPHRIWILGALGQRLDHTLTNVHLLERGLDAGVDVRLVDGSRSIALVGGRHAIAGADVGDRVSLIPLSPSVRASTAGLRYPLEDEELRRAASRGVSNEVVSVPALVEVTRGQLLVIHVRRGGCG